MTDIEKAISHIRDTFKPGGCGLLDRESVEFICQEAERLEKVLWTPSTAEFLEAVRIEAAHQRERWGEEHDARKSSEEWFWLLGWLAGKSLCAERGGDLEKARHHTISSAAVLVNWHRRLESQ